jgi:tetratricopeptide (TPR) repeat protein
MKTCPQCYAAFMDEHIYCQRDGAILTHLAEPPTGAAIPLKEPGSYPLNSAVGETYYVSHDSFLPGSEEYSSQLTSSVPNRKKPLILLATIGAITILALVIVVYLSLPSAKRSILAEIRKGNLVNLNARSAYDLFIEARGKLTNEDIAEISAEAVPAAEERSNQILARLKQDSSDSESEWAECARLNSWLIELRPNPAYESRKYFSQARLKFLKKDYSGSIADYSKAIQSDRNWALPFNGLGRAYVNLKDQMNARENYRRAIQVEPDWIYPYLNLAALYLETGDYKAAEDSLKEALRIDTNKATVYYLLGLTYEKMERWCDCLSNLRQALTKPNNSPSTLPVDGIRTKINRLESKYRCD